MKQVYMAKDGTIFNTEAECRYYERLPRLVENAELKKQMFALMESNSCGYTPTDLLEILKPMNITKKRLTVQRVTALLSQLRWDGVLVRADNQDRTVTYKLKSA